MMLHISVKGSLIQYFYDQQSVSDICTSVTGNFMTPFPMTNSM